jgi:hypothetical protein
VRPEPIDFEVGERVYLKGHPNGKGTIAEAGIGLLADGRRYRIEFDDGVGNHYWFPWHQIVRQEGEE